MNNIYNNYMILKKNFTGKLFFLIIQKRPYMQTMYVLKSATLNFNQINIPLVFIRKISEVV